MRTGFALVVCLLLLTIPISTSTGWAPSPGCPVLPDPQILAAFDEVIEFIGNLPRDTLKPWLRISLIWNLECAKRTYQQGHPCTAIYVLKAFLMQAQALRRGPRAPGRGALIQSGSNASRQAFRHTLRS